MNRREFISLTNLALASYAMPTGTCEAAQASNRRGIEFAFFTDTHIQPELNAPSGCAMAFEKIRSLRPAFAVQGGDHVYDAIGATHGNAAKLFDLYARTEQALAVKTHHVMGNHDVFGLSAANLESDPEYGKKMYQDRFGSIYYSFDFAGYHFIVLDSIQLTPDFSYEARIDTAQLGWLKKDLVALPKEMPTLVFTHVPLVTGALSYGPYRADKVGKTSIVNAYEVLPLFESRNVLGVFQGHTHINEVVRFRRIPYISCGAVCGNWWHGSRWGTPEGFTMISLNGDECNWRYHTYGFRSVDPQDS
ncbi:MAG TPA: metallophosphoesterase [Terracidiphilus sp.]